MKQNPMPFPHTREAGVQSAAVPGKIFSWAVVAGDGHAPEFRQPLLIEERNVIRRPAIGLQHAQAQQAQGTAVRKINPAR